METARPAQLQRMKHRFTIDGSDQLEEFLERLCSKAASRVAAIMPPEKIAAILLGGGYGRGEGGVLKSDHADQPYNDLEFYILHTGNSLLIERRAREAVHSISEQLTKEAGIEVEFKLLSLSKLERSPVTMFYYDLISAHYSVFGDQSCLRSCDHHRAAHRIPLHEGTRLLMNRCSGLLYSEEKLLHEKFTREDADFVGRNLAKAKLAFGDVLLVANGVYHWSCRERHKRLAGLEPEPSIPSFRQLVEWHREGVDFKLHPSRSAARRFALNEELTELKKAGLTLWLWLEERRLKKRYAAPAEYALDPIDKCPETNKWKNHLINLHRFGPSGLGCATYPRERLLNTLPLLLWVPEITRKIDLLKFGQKQLFTSSRDFPSLVQAYQSIWRNFN
jgi:hypothetical protein